MIIPFPLLALLCVICAPILFFQAKRVRQRVPNLPEAKNPSGQISQINTESFNLLVLGESTMAGVGIKDHKNGFASSLASYLSNCLSTSVNWEVQARSGFTTGEITKELLPLISMETVDLIVIGTGANDAFSLHSPGRFARDIKKMLNALKGVYPHSPIVFINMPPISYFPAFTKLMQYCIGTWVKHNGLALSKLIQEYEQVFYMKEDIIPEDWFDKYENFGNINDMFSDGVHPSKTTYKLWAKECFSFILTNHVLQKQT